MSLYSLNACDLVIVCELIRVRSAGRPAASLSRAPMAAFSPAEALPVVPCEVRATRSAAAARLVFASCARSAARFGPVGLDR